MIYGERIKQSRELQGLTQSELAGRLGVTQSNIAQIETGRSSPSIDLAEGIARETRVLPSFFERKPSGVSFATESLAYRARSTATARERNRALQCMRLFIEHVRYMSTYLSMPSLRLPTEDNPSRAAILTRLEFELDPFCPIAHLVNVIERQGIIVFSLPFQMQKVDAFSTWATIGDEHPVMVLSSGLPGDRIRYSAAHELGHLVMHKESYKSYRVLEEEANQFAAEFLLPETPMREHIRNDMTLTDAAHLKNVWLVSMQAIVRRARDLEIITERRYRYLFSQISKNGWRKNEPVEVPAERPRLYRQMAEMIYGSGRTHELGRDAGIEADMMDELIEPYDVALDSEPHYIGRQIN